MDRCRPIRFRGCVLNCNWALRICGHGFLEQTSVRSSNIGFCGHRWLEAVEAAFSLGKFRRHSVSPKDRYLSERECAWDVRHHIQCNVRKCHIEARAVPLLLALLSLIDEDWSTTHRVYFCSRLMGVDADRHLNAHSDQQCAKDKWSVPSRPSLSCVPPDQASNPPC